MHLLCTLKISIRLRNNVCLIGICYRGSRGGFVSKHSHLPSDSEVNDAVLTQNRRGSPDNISPSNIHYSYYDIAIKKTYTLLYNCVNIKILQFKMMFSSWKTEQQVLAGCSQYSPRLRRCQHLEDRKVYTLFFLYINIFVIIE